MIGKHSELIWWNLLSFFSLFQNRNLLEMSYARLFSVLSGSKDMECWFFISMTFRENSKLEILFNIKYWFTENREPKTHAFAVSLSLQVFKLIENFFFVLTSLPPLWEHKNENFYRYLNIWCKSDEPETACHAYKYFSYKNQTNIVYMIIFNSHRISTTQHYHKKEYIFRPFKKITEN